MMIENPALLIEFRTPGPCELCRRFASVREPHHIRAKGFGGGGCLDVRINLIAVGGSAKGGSGFRKFSCHCHKLAEARKIDDDFILAIVAQRESCKPSEITEVMDWLRRVIHPNEAELRAAFAQLSEGGRQLAVKELVEAGEWLDTASVDDTMNHQPERQKS